MSDTIDGTLVELGLPSVADVIKKDLDYIYGHTDTVLANALQDMVVEGKTVQDVKQALKDAGIFDPARALTCARTLAGTATSVGQIRGANAAGATHKTWRDSGFNVRDQHIARNGETVEIGKRFSPKFGESFGPMFPGDPASAPADRINCRCAMSFEMRDVETLVDAPNWENTISLEASTKIKQQDEIDVTLFAKEVANYLGIQGAKINLKFASVGTSEAFTKKSIKEPNVFEIILKPKYLRGLKNSSGPANTPGIDHYDMLEILTHEMSHVKQYQKGELGELFIPEKRRFVSTWKGEAYNKDGKLYSDLTWGNRPWEMDAIDNETRATPKLMLKLIKEGKFPNQWAESLKLKSKLQKIAKADGLKYVVTSKSTMAAQEFAFVYDEEGQVLIQKPGVSRSVSFTNDEIKLMEDSKGVVLIHNHPGGLSLSPEDVKFADRIGGEIIAFGNENRVEYSATNVQNSLSKEFDTDLKKISNYADVMIMTKLSSGTIPSDEANILFYHILNSALSKKGYFDYSVKGLKLSKFSMTLFDSIMSIY